ncbi:MAG TPA: hypothetical protein ENH23_00040, partial [candidate division Zixibacteria bacterium]|nr:hypothetical protein [candidate division Zixibacteria bacterium]
MKRKNWINRSLKVLLLSPFLLFLQTLHAADSTPIVPNETCLECHDEMSETLTSTPHQLQDNKSAVYCISCHAGGKEHIEDPSTDNII